MDNLTHSLTGLALARAGLNRVCPHATLLLILSANVPDIDIVALSRGPLKYLEAHRGYTHSLLFLPLMALLTVLVVAGIARRRLPWLIAWLLCCAGVASHLLLDWTNSYGIRLLLPFSSAWFHLDLNGLYDVVIWTVLVIAAVWPSFAGLVGAEIGDSGKGGRGIAIAALLFFGLFDGGRAMLHARALSQLNARLYDDAFPIASAALPNSVNPLRWKGVVETAASYLVMDVVPLSNQFDPNAAQVFYKPAIDANIRVADTSEAFRYFEYFARFPVRSEYPIQIDCAPGVRVEMTDLRFGIPGSGSFRVSAFVRDGKQVVPERLGDASCP